MISRLAKTNVIRAIKYLKWCKNKDENDSLVIFIKNQSLGELNFFFKHRHNLSNFRTNGFGKFYID